MGKSLTNARISVGAVRLISAVQSRHSDPIPHNAGGLHRALESIVRNTEARDPHEGRVLKAQLQYLAGFEELKPESMNDQVLPDEEGWLKDLGKQFPRQGGTHTSVTIAYQKQLIMTYWNLRDHQFPERANNIAAQHDWLSKHAPNLFGQLAELPCFCSYQTTFTDDDWKRVRADRDKKGKSPMLTKAHVILLLLAHLHNSGPDEIKKLLAQSLRFS